jgi:hypothetical protein
VEKKPFFTGTFLQPDLGLTSWSELLWNKEFRDLKRLKMEIVIVQYTGGGERAYYPSKLSWFSHSYNLLDSIMAAAERHKINIFLGLYLNKDWWSNYKNIKYLRAELKRNQFVIEELTRLYGKHPSFRGWYIPHELGNLPYLSWCQRRRLAWFFRSMAKCCKSYDATKPVSIAPFFSSQVNLAWFGRVWYQFLKNSLLDLVMLQDGVGCKRVTIEQSKIFFAEMRKACQKAGLELWGDLEIFEQYHGYPIDSLSFAAKPGDINTIKKQMEAVYPFVSNLVCFEYNHYMSICRGEEERRLNLNYKREILSFQ